MKVFLGGTCNNSKWRERLIPLLKIDYFDPVTEDWNEEAQLQEIKERETTDFCLYTLTPMIGGVYSIAEVVDDSNKRPEKTILCVLERDPFEYDGEVLENIWSEPVRRSLTAVEKMVERNGAKVFRSLEEVAEYLNQSAG